MHIFYPGHNACVDSALTQSKENLLAICHRNAIAGEKVIN